MQQCCKNAQPWGMCSIMLCYVDIVSHHKHFPPPQLAKAPKTYTNLGNSPYLHHTAISSILKYPISLFLVHNPHKTKFPLLFSNFYDPKTKQSLPMYHSIPMYLIYSIFLPWQWGKIQPPYSKTKRAHASSPSYKPISITFNYVNLVGAIIRCMYVLWAFVMEYATKTIQLIKECSSKFCLLVVRTHITRSSHDPAMSHIWSFQIQPVLLPKIQGMWSEDFKVVSSHELGLCWYVTTSQKHGVRANLQAYSLHCCLISFSMHVLNWYNTFPLP